MAVMLRRALLLALPGGLVWAADSVARRKFDRLRSDRLAPGSTVEFSAKEVNDLAAETLAEEEIEGVTQPRVALGRGTVTGNAHIDFAKVRTGLSGQAPGTLDRLIAGERDVSVEALLQATGGMCQVDVQRVVVSGVEIRGVVLDWLIANYLLPMYPEAKVGKPFEIGYRIESIDIEPERVRLKIGDQMRAQFRANRPPAIAQV
jgi:hypothetical protein